MSGWVKLHRSMLDWEWFGDHDVFRLFTYLLMAANHEPDSWRGVTVNPGQIITGRIELAKATGLSEQRVRTALAKLQATSDLTINSTNQFSLITINKWAKYQQQQPAPEPANAPMSNHNRRSKETKKDSLSKAHAYPPQFENFWKAYPANGSSKGEAFKSFQKHTTEADHDRITARAKLYADFCKRTCRPVANATTWLNNARWEVDYTGMLAGHTGAHAKPFGGAQAKQSFTSEAEALAASYRAQANADPVHGRGQGRTDLLAGPGMRNAESLRPDGIEPENIGGGLRLPAGPVHDSRNSGGFENLHANQGRHTQPGEHRAADRPSAATVIGSHGEPHL